MTLTECRIDPSTISPALERARSIITETILIGSSSLQNTGILLSIAAREADSPIKMLVQALLDASVALQKHTSERYREATTSSQALALGFISEQTEQSLPGVLTLLENGYEVSLQVDGVDIFYCHNGKWSATLRVQTRPQCHSTRRIYLNEFGQVRWEKDFDC